MPSIEREIIENVVRLRVLSAEVAVLQEPTTISLPLLEKMVRMRIGFPASHGIPFQNAESSQSVLVE
jgi:hypothetical protein